MSSERWFDAAAGALQGYYFNGNYGSASVYPPDGLPADCFPYCGPNAAYSQPFVTVKFTGIKLGENTAVVCSAHVSQETVSELQQTDRLASTNFAFVIHGQQ